MKKITGLISFIGSVIGFIFLIYIFFKGEIYDDQGRLIAWFGFFILSVGVFHYTLITRFWTSKISVLDSLDRENEIIKKQIEKRELLSKLEALEKQ